MRLRIAVASAVLLVACSAFAQQANRFSVYLTNPGFEASSQTFRATGGIGLAFDHFWTPRFSTELVASAERYNANYSAYDPERHSNVVHYSGYDVNPIDLLAQYHFLNDSRWKPYIGAGLRYAHRPTDVFTGTPLAPELNGGVMMQITPRFGLTFDGRLAAASSTKWNPSAKGSFGLTWRF